MGGGGDTIAQAVIGVGAAASAMGGGGEAPAGGALTGKLCLFNRPRWTRFEGNSSKMRKPCAVPTLHQRISGVFHALAHDLEDCLALTHS